MSEGANLGAVCPQDNLLHVDSGVWDHGSLGKFELLSLCDHILGCFTALLRIKLSYCI